MNGFWTTKIGWLCVHSGVAVARFYLTKWLYLLTKRCLYQSVFNFFLLVFLLLFRLLWNRLVAWKIVLLCITAHKHIHYNSNNNSQNMQKKMYLNRISKQRWDSNRFSFNLFALFHLMLFKYSISIQIVIAMVLSSLLLSFFPHYNSVYASGEDVSPQC